MLAGSATTITDFDGWMLRNWWYELSRNRKWQTGSGTAPATTTSKAPQPTSSRTESVPAPTGGATAPQYGQCGVSGIMNGYWWRILLTLSREMVGLGLLNALRPLLATKSTNGTLSAFERHLSRSLCCYNMDPLSAVHLGHWWTTKPTSSGNFLDIVLFVCSYFNP
jgi:hypothetical protein